MKFVLDASAAINIAVPQALGDSYAQGVMEQRNKPVCPHTWRVEVASGLHQAYLERKISEVAAATGLATGR